MVGGYRLDGHPLRVGMALFDFEIIYSGIVSIPIVPDTEMGITVYAKFTDAFGVRQHETVLYLNPHIASSGFDFIKVGGMAIGGSLTRLLGVVIGHNRPSRSVIVDVDGTEYDCDFRPNEKMNINDTVLVFEHIGHHPGRFNNFIWFATKKSLYQPGILSMHLDLMGGGSGIGRVNLDPYTGRLHYGSGLES